MSRELSKSHVLANNKDDYGPYDAQKRACVRIKYPLTTEELKYIGYIFVDNTDLILIAKENKTIICVKYRQQQSTLCWEKHLN